MNCFSFTSFREATKTLKEYLVKEGHLVGKTKELTNVAYMVLKPDLSQLVPHQPWADQEFLERIKGFDGTAGVNPGMSWRLQTDIWVPMMEEEGKFSYTYSERMAHQLGKVVEELHRNVDSRESLITIWQGEADSYRLSKRRVPCTLGYQFLIRQGQLELTYLQRSCNLEKHYQDDVWQAHKLQMWMAEKVTVTVGAFHHWIGSFHYFI